MNWEFLVFGFGTEVRRYPIRQGVDHIGRHDSVAYRLDENAVARQAIEVRAKGDRVTVADMGNRAAIYINKKIKLQGKYVLKPGDVINLCDHLIKFQQASPGGNDTPDTPALTERESNPEYRALLEAILANPADDAPRIAIANWLEEHNFSDFAGHIRTQLAQPNTSNSLRDLAYTSSNYVIYQSMLKKWLEIFSIAAWYWGFRRGFICEIEMSSQDFMTHARELFSLFPIEKVRLPDLSPTWTRQSPGGETFSWSDTPRFGLFGSDCEINSGRVMPEEFLQLLRENPDPVIPEELLQLLQIQGNPVNLYSSRDEALEALSAACVAYGRSL